MGDVIRAFPGKKIVVDHHVSDDDLGAEQFKNTQAEATGRLVVEAAEALGVKLTPEMAMPLFAAMATDTGLVPVCARPRAARIAWRPS